MLRNPDKTCRSINMAHLPIRSPHPISSVSSTPSSNPSLPATPSAIKREYGRDPAFWGRVGTQTTLPCGSVAEVRAAVRTLITTAGAGGGFLIAPTHLVEPEVSWETILAFGEAVKEFGRYTG